MWRYNQLSVKYGGQVAV